MLAARMAATHEAALEWYRDLLSSRRSAITLERSAPATAEVTGRSFPSWCAQRTRRLTGCSTTSAPHARGRTDAWAARAAEKPDVAVDRQRPSARLLTPPHGGGFQAPSPSSRLAG